jgi:arsenate reductase
MGELSLYFNPRCSKCRTAQGLLAERAIDAHVIEYLKAPPSVPELRVLMGKLGISDPRQMMRRARRPIVVQGDRAVIARPPELLLDLLGS